MACRRRDLGDPGKNRRLCKAIGSILMRVGCAIGGLDCSLGCEEVDIMGIRVIHGNGGLKDWFLGLRRQGEVIACQMVFSYRSQLQF